MQQPVHLGIVSPSREVYSETFIQAHRQIPGTVSHYYYGDYLPTQLEGKGPLLSPGKWVRVGRGIKRLWFSQNQFEEKAFIRSLKRDGIACVLAEYGPTGIAVMEACKQANIPLIVHFHGYDASKKDLLERHRTDYRQLFEYASSVVVVSAAMRNRLSREVGDFGNYALNPYGPHRSFFEVRATYAKPQLLAVGRFVDKKAPYYTILAFARAFAENSEARLVMIGDGPLLDTCRNLVRHLGLEHRVQFPGIQSREQIQAWQAESRVFVQHSVTAGTGDMEGTPVGILEAMASGLPVISTRHAGIPEVVEEGKSGLLVDEHDVDGMAKHMKDLLLDADRVAEMGQAARERIRQHFTMEQHLERHRQLILEAIGG